MIFSDSHFHSLSIKAPLAEIYSLLALGLDIATRPSDTERILSNIAFHDNIHTSIAAGPWCAGDDNSDVFKDIFSLAEKYATSKKVVAIGEIGLDYFHKDYAEANVQKALFYDQLSLAEEKKFPVILHVRDSFSDVIDVLKGFKLSQQGIVHCFSAGVDVAKKFLDMGFYIAFGGNITYKANGNIREAVAYTPIDRLLVETDAPYLSPEGKRGEKNTPLNIPIILDKMAMLREKSDEDIALATLENLKSFVAQRCA